MFDNNGYYDKDRTKKFVDNDELYRECENYIEDNSLGYNTLNEDLNIEIPDVLNESTIEMHELPETCFSRLLESGLGKKESLRQLLTKRVRDLDDFNDDFSFIVNENANIVFEKNKESFRGYACDCYVMNALAESLGYTTRDYKRGLDYYKQLVEDSEEWKKDRMELHRIIEACEATGVPGVVGGTNGPTITNGDVRVPADVKSIPSTKVLKEKDNEEEPEADIDDVDITIEDYSVFGEDMDFED